MALPQALARPTTVAEYIAAADKPARAKLRELRKAIRAAAPGAREELKWSMPAYSYQRILVVFGAFKNHVSLFPTTPVVRAFKKDLAKFKPSGSTIKFPLTEPLPLPLIRRMVAFRVKLSLEKDGKWRTKR